jgi:hypothetical protein
MEDANRIENNNVHVLMMGIIRRKGTRIKHTSKER